MNIHRQRLTRYLALLTQRKAKVECSGDGEELRVRRVGYHTRNEILRSQLDPKVPISLSCYLRETCFKVGTPISSTRNAHLT